jgi:hypothetical protein
MIDDKEREIIKSTFGKGRSKKEIARFFRHDVKTVRSVISSDDKSKMRKDKIIVDEELLRTLYQECGGYKQRIYEKLTEEMGIKIGYSTLTRLLREYRLGKEEERDKSYPDIPGEEMQQDTSVYYAMIGDKKVKVICSGIYLRYSKMRYVKFYLRYNRFTMKCFFYEALAGLGYYTRVCIIDNTNLAVLYGTGEHAVFNPEMIFFARQYGFVWKAHRIRHANRKAGKERNFLTLETNFFPGRHFKSLNDLNEQARQWCLQRFANRPLSKTKLIPRQLFELEKSYLIKLPEYIQEPYCRHERESDTYGFAAFDGNYYWLPEKIKGRVRILEYEKRIVIYQGHKELVSYDLPEAGVKNKRIMPAGMEDLLRYQPRHMKKRCEEEERQLRAQGAVVAGYLDYILSPECSVKQKPRFVRELYRLSKQMTKELFAGCLQRALQYRIDKIDALQNIAGLLLNAKDDYHVDISPALDFENRVSYQQGRVSKEEDLGIYQEMLEEKEDANGN